MASTLCMHIGISAGQWQPWTAVSSLLGLISMVRGYVVCLLLFIICTKLTIFPTLLITLSMKKAPLFGSAFLSTHYRGILIQG